MVDEMLEELADDVCLDLLQRSGVGRVAVVVDGYPVVVPVNYRLVALDGEPTLVFATRAGNVIDRGPVSAALQIDGVDPAHHCGWSVLARGSLHPLDAETVAVVRDRVEPLSWVPDRDAWLGLDRLQLSGRRLRAPEVQWAFHIRGYL